MATAFVSCDRLGLLIARLEEAGTVEARCHLLDQEELLRSFPKREQLEELELEDRLLLMLLVAMGQSQLVEEALSTESTQLQQLIGRLRRIERFYSPLGGLLGYQQQVLRLIEPQEAAAQSYQRPQGFDLQQRSADVRRAVLAGIEALPFVAEIYPVGGAGDRLGLVDSHQQPLPTACLRLLGRTLLERLVRDLQGREYLYYKLTGQQLETPILMMTSEQDSNHNQILALCEEQDWYGRAPHSFRFVTQPMVPMVTEDGLWVACAPGELWLKPGGHGVLWHLAHSQEALAWLQQEGRRWAIVRQINNPLAGTDDGMLAFCGTGIVHDKRWGFASCARAVGASEGMLVQVARDSQVALSNVEYTEFVRQGIADVPEHEGSCHSAFPSNINLLFVHLETVEQLVARHPFPGLLINWKHQVGDKKAGRLEATMQNLADVLTATAPEQLPTYLTYGARQRTISAIKRSYRPGELAETPQQAFYDLLGNHYEILNSYCNFELPPLEGLHPEDPNGPTCIFQLHPALGPLFEIIGQKIRGGRMAAYSQLIFDIVNCDISELDLDGRLHIEARQLMGHLQDQRLHYSEQTGRCRLQRVKVRTSGWQPAPLGDRWQRRAPRDGCLHIVLHGTAELDAQDVTLTGPDLVEVPTGHRLTLRPSGAVLEPINAPSWQWHYAITPDQRICLTLV